MKNFKRVPWKMGVGTSLRGYVDVSYAKLVRTFGRPDGPSADNKIDAHWTLQFGDGTIATIYNYKDGKAYLGPQGKPVKEIRDWHVGGKGGGYALRYVQMALAKVRLHKAPRIRAA